MKTIIAGSREFNDREYLERELRHHPDPITAVLSGCARGADALGAQWAREQGIAVVEFPADWLQYGRAAGPVRNKQMADNADALIAFWDGHSTGTASMIREASKRGLRVTVHRYSKGLRR